MAPTFKDVYGEKYLLLTTFTKDGRPKPTTVWGVPEGDKLLIITDDGSWKTKRINNTPRVTIQKAGVLGKVKGEPVEAVARNAAEVGDPAGVRQGHQALLVARVVVDPAGDRRAAASTRCTRDRGAPRPHAGAGTPRRSRSVGSTWRCGCS